MSEYLIINILIVIAPLVMSFEKKLHFYNNYNSLAVTILFVGFPFLTWDIIAAGRGDWLFNYKYVSGLFFFGLPIEEILFFITVPYSIIFLYETLNFYLKPNLISLNNKYFILPSLLCFISSAFFYRQNYTFMVLLFLGYVFLIFGFSKLNFTKNKYFFYFILFSFVPFFIVNYFLTSLPVVQYNPEAIWGIRIITIPLEDFFYSLSLILSYLFTYSFIKTKWKSSELR